MGLLSAVGDFFLGSSNDAATTGKLDQTTDQRKTGVTKGQVSKQTGEVTAGTQKQDQQQTTISTGTSTQNQNQQQASTSTGTNVQKQTGGTSGTQTQSATDRGTTEVNQSATTQTLSTDVQATLEDVLDSIALGATSEGGFASAQAGEGANELLDLARLVGAESGTVRDDIIKAAEAAVATEALKFEQSILPQVEQAGQLIGSRDNSAFAKINARAREDLGVKSAGIIADSAVAGSQQEAAKQGLAISGLSEGVNQFLNLAEGQSGAVASLSNLASILKGATSTTEATGATAEERVSLSDALSELISTSDTETASTQDVINTVVGETTTTASEDTIAAITGEIETRQERQLTENELEEIVSLVDEHIQTQQDTTGSNNVDSRDSLVDLLGLFA